MDYKLESKLHSIAQDIVKTTSEHFDNKDIPEFIRSLFSNMLTVCTHIGREMDYLRQIERSEKGG